MQTRTQSLIEAILNTLSGFVVTMIVQSLVYPLFNIHTSVGQNFNIALIFTFTSIARSYVWRRVFNRRAAR